jgi:RNA polymerase sigma-70 factor (ECF subfamily)
MVEVIRNHQAFLDIALPHLDVVWSLARRMAIPPLEPEDLVQDTYLRAFAGFDRYRGGDARAWLVSICLNTARSHGRRAKRRPREVPGPDESIPSDTDVGAEAMRTVDREMLEAALAELPDAQRTAILLMDVSGLTAQQTAEAIGAPRGTILARVHRGRRKLAQLLRERNAIDDV